MKKTFATAFLTLATALGFSQEIPSEQSLSRNDISLDAKSALKQEMVSNKKSFVYLRMGVSDSHPTDSVKVLPGMGLGYRLIAGASALDLSATGNRYITRDAEGEKKTTHFYTLPKANYLYYISPAKNNSLYVGGGLAWGGLKTKDDREFTGIISNAAVGYEMNRSSTVRSFVQLDVSQPAVAAVQKNAFPGPFAEFSVGAGF
ncbi:MAG: hypothetical protein V4487_01690 [Chlamydiota bacterium]